MQHAGRGIPVGFLRLCRRTQLVGHEAGYHRRHTVHTCGEEGGTSRFSDLLQHATGRIQPKSAQYQ